MFKKIIIGILVFILGFVGFFSYASNWTIIPEGGSSPIDPEPGTTWDEYNAHAKNTENLPGNAFADGTFTWTTVMNYLKYVGLFLSNVGLVTGACMVIFGGYKYAMGVFTGKSTTGNEPIKLAIIGVLIIIFAYAIMRIMILAFLGG